MNRSSMMSTTRDPILRDAGSTRPTKANLLFDPRWEPRDPNGTVRTTSTSTSQRSGSRRVSSQQLAQSPHERALAAAWPRVDPNRRSASPETQSPRPRSLTSTAPACAPLSLRAFLPPKPLLPIPICLCLPSSFRFSFPFLFFSNLITIPSSIASA